MGFDSKGLWIGPKLKARERARLVRRFELTIPHRRLVRVIFKDLSAPQMVEGYPAYVLAEMLYLRTPDGSQLIPVPKALVLDIVPVYPRLPQDILRSELI